MILVAGGTGRLGTEVTRRLTHRGLPVRILTRNPAHSRPPGDTPVEVAQGDVRDPDSIARAMSGVHTVISAMHGFVGTGTDSPRTIDFEGNRNLVVAAAAQGVEHFIMMSIHGAAPDHPMELFRMKYLAEQEVRGSGLAWTIIRPTAYMETYLDLIAKPLLKSGKTRIFGRGANPINFVSVHDVAALVEEAVVDPHMRGRAIDIGGPENLTMEQLAELVQEVTGKTGSVGHVPLPMMRVMATVARPVNGTLARQIQAGVVMDTRDMAFTGARTGGEGAPRPLSHLTDVIRREYAR